MVSDFPSPVRSCLHPNSWTMSRPRMFMCVYMFGEHSRSTFLVLSMPVFKSHNVTQLNSTPPRRQSDKTDITLIITLPDTGIKPRSHTFALHWNTRAQQAQICHYAFTHIKICFFNSLCYSVSAELNTLWLYVSWSSLFHKTTDVYTVVH